MANQAALKSDRARIKSQLTRFSTFLAGCTGEKSRELPERLRKCEALWDKFDEVQTELEQLDADEINSEERESFESKYYEAVGLCTGLMSNLREQPAPKAQNIGMGQVKLPVIDLPQFNGAFDQWVAFCDTFKSLIDSNDSLNDTQKLIYLKSCLKGEAMEVLKAVEVNGDNYKICWDLLSDRYENKKLIIHKHLKAIVEIKNIAKESVHELRKLLDDVKKNLRALACLGEDTDSWDTLLLFLITSKLDHVTRREWEKTTLSEEKPSMDHLYYFLGERCHLLETLGQSNSYSRESNTGRDTGRDTGRFSTMRNKSQSQSSRAFVSGTESGKNSCLICGEQHFLHRCPKFLNMTVQARRGEVQKFKLCYNCLRTNHAAAKCEFGSCRYCQRKHNSLLHEDIGATNVNNHAEKSNIQGDSAHRENVEQISTKSTNHHSQASAESSVTAHSNTFTNGNSVLLSTAIIFVEDHRGNLHECRVLLDNGSQSNFIRKDFSDKLQLNYRNINMSITGVGNAMAGVQQFTETTIKSRFNNFGAKLKFLVLDKITDKLPTTFYDKYKFNIPQGIDLADPTFNEPREIDALLGAEIFWNLLRQGQICSKNQPVIQNTMIGWIISGTLPNETKSRDKNITSCNLSTIGIQNQLEKFWLLEETNTQTRNLTKEEEECELHFLEHTKRDKDGRFTVKLPLRENIEEIGDSHNTALKCFSSLEKRFEKNLDFKKKYEEFMTEYIEMGHMTKVSDEERNNTAKVVFVLPHHGVYKADSSTTKLRVVFNGSSPSSTGVSLNDKLKVGPILQDDLFSILIRFRKHLYVLAADVAKMYRMVNLHEDDRDLQRILWKIDGKIEEFRLNTVTYGTSSASFLAIRSLQQIGHENKERFPDACRAILEDFYVDDLLTGTESIDEAKHLMEDMIRVTNEYGFNLRKWVSNCHEILENAATENMTHFISEDTTTKTLGLVWNSRIDTLQYSINIPRQTTFSKRTILSTIAQIFDPLGLVGPCIISAKLIIQRLWQINLQWDEELPLELKTKWIQFYEEIPDLNTININRHILCTKPKEIQLHCFSDASEYAYGACIFVRSTDEDGNHYSNLLCAKSRVSPLKKVTLPRLELCGAQLLSRLVDKVIKTMNLEFDKIQYYTDSTIVLAWLATECNNLKTFVSNRVSEIQKLTNIDDWQHISGKENPADIISRGMNPKQLFQSDLWWFGPSWLTKSEDFWPKSKIEKIDEIPETKAQTFKATAKEDDFIFTKFSNLRKLQRVTAFCLRFKNNSLQERDKRQTGSLTVQELNEALNVLLKLAQRNQFEDEMTAIGKGQNIHRNSTLKCLNPFLDDNGLLRVGGRLKHAHISYNKKHPIILPKKHVLTKLIVRSEHIRQLHAGPSLLLATIRQKYWPISGKNEVKYILRECVKCNKVNPTKYEHIMGNLPLERITPSRPFSVCGVDYAGPFDILASRLRGHKVLKSYLCIFVCFNTKAVHLELVSDLTTEAFLNALKRFLSRRGKVCTIWSDNGKNFLGAKNILDDFSKFLSESRTQGAVCNYLTQEGIEWKTIPPRSPHFGGLWEAAVKSAKTHIKRVIGLTILTYEEMYTLLTQVEAALNSRPIVPLTQDPDDLNFLTPGHFLIGDSFASFPQPDLRSEPPNRLNRYHHLMQINQHFWRQWSRDYLVNLQKRSKWQGQGKNVPLPGTLVIISDDNLPPLKWNVGRINEVFFGSDGVARVATVKTSNGVYKRSINRLCPLIFED